jgi:transketolase
MALADRTKNVYCLISDGECSEGSIWEALRIKNEQKLDNLLVYANINGWGAYKQITSESGLYEQLERYLVKCIFTDSNVLPFLKGQDAHYYTMNEEDYRVAMEVLK